MLLQQPPTIFCLGWILGGVLTLGHQAQMTNVGLWHKSLIIVGEPEIVGPTSELEMLSDHVPGV